MYPDSGYKRAHAQSVCTRPFSRVGRGLGTRLRVGPHLRDQIEIEIRGDQCAVVLFVVAMAESSSSGEESSEEEEEEEEEEEVDESSPSLRGPDSTIAAASKTNRGKKLGFISERGYLKTLSRQERRRIKREIRKGRKPGEITSEVLIENCYKSDSGGM